MSTRCNVVVMLGSSRVFLYRHHDGYLAEAGADLALELKAVAGEPGARLSPEGMADRFLRALFAKRYEKASYENEARPIWELTNDLHGDIEHCYWIYFGRGGLMGASDEGFSVKHAARPRDFPELARWVNGGEGFKSLAEFMAAVNKDREACNRRLAELRCGDNAAYWEKASDYPMIEMEVANG